MVGFPPVAEAEEILVVSRDGAVKEVRDFVREEWVEEPCLAMSTEALVVVVVQLER